MLGPDMPIFMPEWPVNDGKEEAVRTVTHVASEIINYTLLAGQMPSVSSRN